MMEAKRLTVGFITLFSAGYSFPWRIEDQMRNIIVALTAMFIVSFVPIRWVRKVSVAAFAAGCLLLLATELVGVTVKGATRWLDIGVSNSLCACCLHFEATRSGNGHSRFDSRFSRHLFCRDQCKIGYRLLRHWYCTHAASLDDAA